MYRLVIKEEALGDMQNAYDYYENLKSGLGERFLEVLEEYFLRIQKSPELYQIKRLPYREAFIKVFPFVIIYEVIDDSLVIYSIFNTFRNPKAKPKSRK
jgi:hypothetical protein